jgi:hypothetical protein
METVGIVLNVGSDSAEAFERGFREHELPIWQDFQGRGVMVLATLNRLDISTKPVKGAVQYLVTVVFEGPEGHHLHDGDPRFEAWNKLADAYQVAEPYVFGGETIVHAGP